MQSFRYEFNSEKLHQNESNPSQSRSRSISWYFQAWTYDALISDRWIVEFLTVTSHHWSLEKYIHWGGSKHARKIKCLLPDSFWIFFAGTFGKPRRKIKERQTINVKNNSLFEIYQGQVFCSIPEFFVQMSQVDSFWKGNIYWSSKSFIPEKLDQGLKDSKRVSFRLASHQYRLESRFAAIGKPYIT